MNKLSKLPLRNGFSMAEMMLVMALIALVLISLATSFYRLTFEDEFIKYQADALRNLMLASDQMSRYIEKGTAVRPLTASSFEIAYTNEHMAGVTFAFGSDRFTGVTQLLVEVSQGDVVSTLQSVYGIRRSVWVPAQANNGNIIITNNISYVNAPGSNKIKLNYSAHITRKSGSNIRQTNVEYSEWMTLKNQ